MTDAELIEVVAVEVMGWELTVIESREPYPDSFCERKIIERVWWNNSINCPVKHFNPIANANHWMMVVEKVCQEYPFLTIQKISITEWEVIWMSLVIHESLGHAICLAALQAVREGKK